MSFKAKLYVDSKEFNLLSCRYNIFQELSLTGRPASVMMGGGITFELESSDDSTLYEWATNHWMNKNGKITFLKVDENSKFIEIEFKNAYCVNYREVFQSNTSKSMTITMYIILKEMNIGNVGWSREL